MNTWNSATPLTATHSAACCSRPVHCAAQCRRRHAACRSASPSPNRESHDPGDISAVSVRGFAESHEREKATGQSTAAAGSSRNSAAWCRRRRSASTPTTSRRSRIGSHSIPTGPPFAFAGVWRPWTGTRGTKASPEDGEHLLFSFLTTEPNEVVRPVHGKAMPVILTGAACDVWLEADAAEALKLQQPWPADRLSVVARGQRQDAGPAPAEGTLL
jgi:hypothetical protein